MAEPIDFRTHPDRYRHWRLRVEPPLAFLTLDVEESAGLRAGYELKQNSYDLGVDIELHDAVQRLRFEHPEVKAVVVESGKERVFCAGANIGMLGSAGHQHKVNFCKFTNETRLGIEDACRHSGQRYLAALRSTAAGGGYELALATDYVLLADDGTSAVSLPEVALLGVLPGTGGLTRLVDKRRVRRDLADLFCTLEEGVKGRRAAEWGLVDELAPKSRFDEVARKRALELAESSDRPAEGTGIELTPLARKLDENGITYPNLEVEFERERGLARLTLKGPATEAPESLAAMTGLGADFWPLALARELEDALLHLRLNEAHLGLLVLVTSGEPARVAEHDRFLSTHRDDWLVREILLLWKRTLKRIDVSSRTLFALVEPGSCFVGLLAELLLAADRTYMFAGEREEDGRPPPTIGLSELSFGPFPMANGLTRLETRFLGAPERVAAARAVIGERLEAGAAEEAGLVTVVLDEIDWDDEIRIAVEERASFSADALTGMEANLRFAGPETLESKIFGRLSAWQNWIFQRPNAVGEEGALRRYGSGLRPTFNQERA
jgi:benzoyl-CoA-dihydrodiol lyase